MSQPTIYYILNARWPTTRAYGLQVAKVCQGLTQAGAQVQLIVPTRVQSKEADGTDSFVFYGIHNRFPVVRLPSLDVVAWGIAGRITFALQQALFALCAAAYLIGKNGIVYSRDPFTLFLASFVRKDIVWEVHRVPQRLTSWFYRRLIARARGVVCITKGIRQKFIEQGTPLERIMVAPDGIDLAEFEAASERPITTGIDPSKRIVLYTGQLMHWKGVDTLVAAAQLLDDSCQIVIMGGQAADIDRMRSQDRLQRVRFEPFRPHREVLQWLLTAQALVLPNRKDAGVSEFYTSPMKMFEYMAAGKPIVASDLPSIREVLNERNAFLVPSDDPEALAAGIRRVFQESDLAHRLAEQARADVQRYTWRQRADMVLDFIL